MQYEAIVTRDGKRFLIDFPDCPGCQTFADREDDVLPTATEALEGWLEATLAERRLPPRPSKRRAPPGASAVSVTLNPKLAFSVQLRLLRDERALSQKDVARMMGVSQQAVAKLEDPDANPTLDTVSKVARTLHVIIDVTMTPMLLSDGFAAAPAYKRSSSAKTTKRRVKGATRRR